MRYAIVIENAGANDSADVTDLPGCVPPVQPSTKSSARSAKPLNFILTACARMDHQFHLRRAPSDTSTSRPDSAFNQTRRCGP